MTTRQAMITHSTAPPIGVSNVSAIDGRLMLTIEAPSVVMNVPSATSARTAHLPFIAPPLAIYGISLGMLTQYSATPCTQVPGGTKH